MTLPEAFGRRREFKDKLRVVIIEMWIRIRELSLRCKESNIICAQGALHIREGAVKLVCMMF